MKTAAVIIGCWEEHSHNQTVVKCYERIVNSIYQDSSIETVWLSGNHLSTLPHTWYANSRQLFVEESGIDWIRRAFEHRPSSMSVTASHKIVEQPFDGKPRLLVWDGWQIEYLLNHTFAHIQRLQYFGIGWNFGVKRDPIGWGPTCDLIRHKHIASRELATKEDCVLSNISPNSDFRLNKFGQPNFAEHNWKMHNGRHLKQDLNWF